MSEQDNIIVEAASRIFRDLCDPQTINNAGDEAWKSPLWEALEGSGLTRAWVPEELGGAGAALTDGFDVLRVSGGFAVPVPFAETLLAGWALARAGIEAPEGPMTVAPVRVGERLELGRDGKISGRARRVPFARDAGHVVVLARRGNETALALLDRAACDLARGVSYADDPQDDLILEEVKPLRTVVAKDGLDAESLLLMGAVVRTVQMAGALQSILDISVQYAKDRVAFGRPIAKFQAVQQNLARLAGETAAAVAASGSAADAIARSNRFGETIFLEIASAKIRVGEAAGEGAAIAHQVHGAIGFTIEHVLHRFTRRLWSWRDDFGSESVWAVRLGERIAAKGGDAVWPTITAA